MCASRAKIFRCEKSVAGILFLVLMKLFTYKLTLKMSNENYKQNNRNYSAQASKRNQKRKLDFAADHDRNHQNLAPSK